MEMLRRRRLSLQLLLVVSSAAGLAVAAGTVLPLLACAPWLVGIVLFARRNGAGEPDALPSAADAARRRWVS
jgi:hypothetical protein